MSIMDGTSVKCVELDAKLVELKWEWKLHCENFEAQSCDLSQAVAASNRGRGLIPEATAR